MRKLGRPQDFAYRYYQEGADELVCIDVVASLFNRKISFEVIKKISENAFIPLTVGGGLSNLKDVEKCFLAGCDRVTINTALIKNIKFASQIVKTFGSQALQASIQVKKIGNTWLAFYEAGRENSLLNLKEYSLKLEALGVGEILLTSVDRDGTMKGFDFELIEEMRNLLSIPVVFGGGYSNKNDLKRILNNGYLSGVAVASALHYKKCSINNIKSVFNKL